MIMLAKVRGIMLHHINYGESSAVAHVYTDLYGRQSYLINKVRGKRARFPASLLQPLYLLELEVYHKNTRELQRIKEVRSYLPFVSLPFDLIKSTQAIFMSEIISRTVREEEANPDLYGFLEKSIQVMDALEKSNPVFHLYFMVQLTRHLGFLPEDNYSEGFQGFDMRNGQFADTGNYHSEFMSQESSRLLHEFLVISYAELDKISTSQVSRNNFLVDMLDYYRLHIHGLGTVKSLSVLQEIFRN